MGAKEPDMEGIVFIGREGNKYSTEASQYADTPEIHFSTWDRPMPDYLIDLTGEYLLCFLCTWVIPSKVLGNFRHCINFHPAPPKYPGRGGYDLALMNKDELYGVTCHHMNPTPDTGKIISTRYFPIDHKKDTVERLRDTAHFFLLYEFKFIFDNIRASTLKNMVCDEEWDRWPYTKKELEEKGVWERKP
jgi:methionyl-tRNA formyltransferase